MNKIHPSHYYNESKDKKIKHFLKAVPHLEFSEKGLFNIAKKFDISIEKLKEQIEEFRNGK